MARENSDDQKETASQQSAAASRVPLGYEGQLLDGKYQVVRLIGKGGMGAVYEARHAALGRQVAVKFLHPEYAQNPEVLRRFHQEAQIAGGLGHPNICEVTDIGHAPDGAPYMVMPFLKGRTLTEAMRAGVFGFVRAIEILEQVLSALEAAHEAGIVHRDLKPDNIFLVSAGEDREVVRILDFGISKVVSDDPALRGLTMTGVVMGTPYYMAPEQARGSKHVDQRVDVYSAGVILYEMLTGRRPFEAETFNALIIKIATEPFAPPRQVRPEMPGPLEAVVLRAMAREASDRYSSAREFRHALQEVRRGIESGVGVVAPAAGAGASEAGGPGQAEAESSHSDPDWALASAPTMASSPGTRPEEGGDQNAGSPQGAAAASGAAEWTASRPGERLSSSTTMAAASEGVPRRSRWAFVGALTAAVALGALALFLWGPLGRRGNRPAGQVAAGDERRGRVDSGSAAEALGSPGDGSASRPQTVRIRFLGLPASAQITVEGRLVQGKQIHLSKGKTPVHYKVQTRDGRSTQGTVVPDQDREVLVSLSAEPKARPMGAPNAARFRASGRGRVPGRRWARPRRAVARAGTRSAAGPRPRVRRAAPRAATARARAARPRVVKGRRGTDISLDY